MRVLAGALLVLALVAAASATTVVPIYSKGSLGKGAFGKQSCGAPIGRVACRIDPSGYVSSVFFSQFSNILPAFGGVAPNAGGRVDYLGPMTVGSPNNFFTQNYCGAFGWIGACEQTGSQDVLTNGGIQLGFQTVVINWGGATVGTTAVAPIPAKGAPLNLVQQQPIVMNQPVLTSMTICWGKKGIQGITFGATRYDTWWGWTGAAAAQPIPMFRAATPAAPFAFPIPAPGTCGTTTNCLATTTYTAPAGKAIGGFDWKCKANQDWVGFKQTGTYGTGGAGKNKYRLKDIYKVCLTDVAPYPNSRFIACDGDPNTCPAAAPAATCPPTSDFWRHQCQCNNGFYADNLLRK